ncbi:MAG: polysaccharide biosynthesis/export family protein [Terracidiphilus sp.]|jgi:polysaccharide export outer membrane protein
MKLGSLLIVAVVAPALFCRAQDNAPAGQPTAQETAKPAAQGQDKPDAGSPQNTPANRSQKEPDVATFLGHLVHPKTTTAPQATAKPAAPEAPAPGPQATSAPAGAEGYVIGPSDVLNVTVFKDPTLSGSLLVRPDGMISISLLGDVKASGKTPLQLAEEITVKLKKYIQDPNVTVILNQINSKKVFLIGEVGKTGPIEMTPGMTLLEAIATAGGLSQFANSKKIYILRSECGKQQKIPVQYKQALAGDASLNLALKPGDTIVVP